MKHTPFHTVLKLATIGTILFFLSCSPKKQPKPVTITQNDSAKIKHFHPDPLDSLYAHITVDASTKFQVDKLSLLGKVWGFLKYYHPAVAAGKFDWDEELIKLLPGIDSASSIDRFNVVIIGWIDHLGPVLKVPPDSLYPSPVEKIKMQPDFRWVFESPLLNPKAKKQLEYIFNNRNRGNNFYVTYAPAGNPAFDNEVNHDSRNYPIPGLRLVSLFRYWNVINYFFPYKYLTGDDWDPVLAEFIPKFVNAKDATDYTLNCLSLISRINDTHANIWGTNEVLDELWGTYYPPFKSSIVENKLVVTGFYTDTLKIKEQIKVGDVIDSIGGKAVADLMKDRLPNIPGSNEAAKMREMPLTLLRNHGGSFDLSIRDGDHIKPMRIPAQNRHWLFNQWYDSLTSGNCYKILGDSIGYINVNKFRNDQVEEMQSLLVGSKGLVMDFRGYPREHLNHSVIPWLTRKSTIFSNITSVDSTTPGMFRFTSQLYSNVQDDPSYRKPVVLLVNAETQSESEFTVMEIQSRSNVKVVGSQTAGADGNGTYFHLPGRILTMISGVGVYYPDNAETQRKGVRIDKVSKPTIEGIKTNTDEVLEDGIEELNKMISKRPG